MDNVKSHPHLGTVVWILCSEQMIDKFQASLLMFITSSILVFPNFLLVIFCYDVIYNIISML